MKNKKSTKHLALAMIAVLALSSCATQQGLVSGNARGAPTHSQWSHFFFFGLGPDDEINAAQICGGADKVQAVEAYLSFGNILASIFPGMFGIIWQPRTTEIYCQ
jgi:hypothetical protein